MGSSQKVLGSPNDDSRGHHEERWPSLEPRGYRTCLLSFSGRPVGRFVRSDIPFLVLFLRPPYDCSWDSAVLYLYRRMRSSRRSPSGCVNEDFEEYSPNSMISRMAHENYLVNGSSRRGSGSVYKQNGRLPKPILALTRPCHPVNTTRESFYISTAVSFGEPERPCVAIQSDSFWTFHITGAYYLFSPATHRSITIPLSKFTDARIFGKQISTLSPHDGSDMVLIPILTC